MLSTPVPRRKRSPGARNVPIYQTTAYVFEDADHAASLFDLQTFGYIYSRITNPTVSALEARVASLEGGRGAVAVASGHAAQLVAFYTLMEPGDHFVASRFLYGGSLTQFSHTFPRLGWRGSLVDPRDETAVRAAITPRTKLIFTESLANPGGLVVDLEMLARIAREHGIPLVVDNTLASPYLCRPFEWGADIVIHSMTKFLGGHGTSMGGIVVESGRFDWSAGRQVPGPQPARPGLPRADLPRDLRRLRIHHEGARRGAPRPRPGALAHQRVQHPDRHRDAAAAHGAPRPQRAARSPASWRPTRLSPGSRTRASSPARRSPLRGTTCRWVPGRCSRSVSQGGYAAGVRLVEGVNLWSHLANVGDTRSLVIHPASTTHRQLTDEQRIAAGAGNDVIRLSVGIETVADLIADLDQALALG